MTFFYYISDFIIPLLIFYIMASELAEKVPVYDEFVTGAADGILLGFRKRGSEIWNGGDIYRHRGS